MPESEHEQQTVVIAEDEADSRALLQRHLERAGYHVRAFSNGRDALDAVRDLGEAVVIADWSMPVMDGIDLCRALRAYCANEVIRFCYVILLTAHSDKERIVAGLDAGADDYLTKPYHGTELLARLRAGQRIAALQRQLRSRNLELVHVNAHISLLNSKLEEMANTDMLTGIANRRSLFARLEELWSQTARNTRPLGLIAFDIDRFKRINDTHGHAAGDAVLRQVASLARGLARSYDIVGRTGGEEFCVIVPDANVENATAVAERIRAGIERERFEFKGVVMPVTVSLGVAERLPAHATCEDLVAQADAMLYRAKDAGRNQIWLTDSSGMPQRYSGALLPV